jgi:Spy/CpxP family protein refolding chaperone
MHRFLIVFLALVTPASVCPLFAAEDSKPASDPFAGAFFPPELVMLAHARIGFTQEQQDALHALLEKTGPLSDQLRTKLQKETAALSALANQDHVDEPTLDAQLDKVLDVERDLKHLHVGFLLALRNLLTPEQQAKMRDIAKDGGTQLEDETRKRLTDKVEAVKAGVQKWADSGRDPSEIETAMTGKFKPLIDSGQVVDAEAELDSLLQQLNQSAK